MMWTGRCRGRGRAMCSVNEPMPFRKLQVESLIVKAEEIMKRIGSSDSLGGLMSICPTLADEQIQGNSHVYSSEFQSMLDDEEPSYVSEKKRRLSMNQVKALEKNFEVENKLEPERKVKLAQELGLQPRQVAVWFQNRRARWKTKQLERDYGLLKANFDALKRNFQNLQHDNQALNTEIQELKTKLQDDKGGINVSCDDREMDQIGSKTESPSLDLDDDDMITECDNEMSTKALNFDNKHHFGLMGTSILTDFKDGSSDSDSSALLNSPNATMSSNERGILQKCSTHQFLISNASSSSSSLAMGGLQFPDTKAAILGDAHKSYLSQFVKIEEHDFFSGEDESCSTFFTDDQPPTLPWDLS